MVKEKLQPLSGNEELLSDNRELILYNDDVNSFDFVINALIEVCDHDPQQAEQCTLIVHFKGKCGVKLGSLEELKPVHTEMCNRKLTVTIN
ncbi:MAG: ATP-dependent Clp protease adaptor ClpS [Bacteroidota bacterium]|nr:ATP-dependent Clp protease adaptor ClpS [Bacteroidota bacterium]